MCDKLVFDLAQEIEGSPSVFVRKDWINILDNQNQNYNNNQSVIDTSQLSNSNKYMSYREGYLVMPMLLTIATQGGLTNTNDGTAPTSAPAAVEGPTDYSIGLKNWFGQMIHSFTLDYNGTTIVQQTPFLNMWNSFRLMTSLSYNDIITQGATIGFYPDIPDSFTYTTGGTIAGVYGTTVPVAGASGFGVCNNTDVVTQTPIGVTNTLLSGCGNYGFTVRQKWINFDNAATVSPPAAAAVTFGGLLNGAGITALNNTWKSYISNKVAAALPATPGVLQVSITGIIYLKHIHPFFNMCPLLKGVFMKLTMNLNNCTTAFTAYSTVAAANPSSWINSNYLLSSVSNPVGGINPMMIASGVASNGGVSLYPTIAGLAANTSGHAGAAFVSYRCNISVGATCLDQVLASTLGVQQGALAKSVYMYVPAYTFNPPFEQAYLSSPIKQIKYSDIYQYQVINVAAGGVFNNLVTNGIANIKSVLILPFYSNADGTGANSGLGIGLPVYQSPFDVAGSGPTSPLCYLTNFNVQISGQNAIYNMERYNFEQFNNQLYGQNAVNGGLTDGITSSLIDRHAFDTSYCYYYVNVERMLPVEKTVPKSVQILGQNMSSKAIDLIVFVEYENEISIDALTGARV